MISWSIRRYVFCMALAVAVAGAGGARAERTEGSHQAQGRTLIDFNTGRLDFWVWMDKSLAGKKIEVFNGDVSLGKKELAEGTVPNSGEIMPVAGVACAEYKLLLPPPNRPYRFVAKLDGKEVGTFNDQQIQRRYKVDYTIDPETWYTDGKFFQKYLHAKTVFDSPVLLKPSFVAEKGKGPAKRSATLGKKNKDEPPAEPTVEDFIGKDYKLEVTYVAPDGQSVTNALLPGDYKANVSLTLNDKTYTYTVPMERKPNAQDMAGISKQDAETPVEMNLFDYTASVDFGLGWITVTLVADPGKLFLNKTVELWSGEKMLGKVTLKGQKDSTRAEGSMRFPILPAGASYALGIKMQGKSVGTLSLLKFAQPAKKIDVNPEMWYAGGVGASANFADRQQWVEGQFFERYLRFDRYIFDAKEGFPKPYMLEPRKLPDAAACSVKSVKDFIGEYTNEVKFLDAKLKEVTAPEAPGRYVAEVTIRCGKVEYKAYEFLFCKPTGKDAVGMPSEAAAYLRNTADKRSAELAAAAWDIKQGRDSGELEKVANNAWLRFKCSKGFLVDTPYKFWVHPPPGYDPNSDKLWPTLIFFHGAGMGGWDVFSQRGGLGFLFRGYGSDSRSKFLIITPNSDGGNWGVNSAAKLVEMLKVMYPIDPNRIILAGQSAGSALAIGLIGSRPDLFCGLILCAHARSMPGYQNEQCVKNNVAIWHFCGELDGTRQQGNADVSFICGVNAGANARYSRIPGWGHGTEHYAFGTGKTFDWMLTLDRRKPCIPKAGGGGERGSLKSRSSSGSLSALKEKKSITKPESTLTKKPESTLTKKKESNLTKSESTLKKPNTLKLPGKAAEGDGGGDAESDEIKGGDAQPPPDAPPPPSGLSEAQQNELIEKWKSTFDPKNWNGALFNFFAHREITYPIGNWPWFWTDAAEAHWKLIEAEQAAAKAKAAAAEKVDAGADAGKDKDPAADGD